MSRSTESTVGAGRVARSGSPFPRVGLLALALALPLASLLLGCERAKDPTTASRTPAAAGDSITASPAAPAGGAAPAPAPQAHAEPEPAEPEEGVSARRVRWMDVEVAPPPAPMEKLAKAGVGLYQQNCQVCHGAQGKADGPAAGVLAVPPRNFTAGQFKFKTSMPGQAPFDDDLYRTLSSGIPAAGMPSFGDLTVFERWALVAHVKNLSQAIRDDGKPFNYFQKRPATTRMKLPAPPDAAKAQHERGELLYRKVAECIQCHGEKGLGDGRSAKDLKDALKNPIKPADLTRGEVTFKTGSRPEDIFRVLTTGMAGTPMPSYEDSLEEEDRWELAFYVTSLYRPIDPGEKTYLRVGCTSCHTIGKGKLIGPDLAGVTKRRDREWLRKWLADPPSMLATDETARKLLEEFLTPMPSYGLTPREVDLLLGYLETLPPAPETAGSVSK